MNQFDIIISNASGEPIYSQISSQIKTMILTGQLKEGEALPSMRNLALQLRISVITTKRAYEELEHDGFIESYTGKGSFVKAQNQELFREEQLRQIEDLLSQACEKAKLAGVAPDELKEILDLIYGGESP
ncbi:MAG: GntR family transcriptional regulator [Oscillospiraceae bacterium]|nr:GntR family transcriptional regulator [Oscillospiraceae bacterium]